jgi:hypothetical protein
VIWFMVGALASLLLLAIGGSIVLYCCDCLEIDLARAMLQEFHEGDIRSRDPTVPSLSPHMPTSTPSRESDESGTSWLSLQNLRHLAAAVPEIYICRAAVDQENFFESSNKMLTVSPEGDDVDSEITLGEARAPKEDCTPDQQSQYSHANASNQSG